MSIKKCRRESARRRTDTHTDRLTDGQTQTDFIICPMLYAIAMGQNTQVAFIDICHYCHHHNHQRWISSFWKSVQYTFWWELQLWIISQVVQWYIHDTLHIPSTWSGLSWVLAVFLHVWIIAFVITACCICKFFNCYVEWINCFFSFSYCCFTYTR